MKAFFRRLFCRHRFGRLIAISYDGAAIYECVRCGKHITKPLS